MENIINKEFGRLTIIGILPKSKVTAKCTCGTIREYFKGNIVKGTTQSCGCLKVQRSKEANTTHGLSNHKLRAVHNLMMQRCYNPNNKRYDSYGGRGITICDEWKDNFINFYNWAIVNGWQEGLQIDREDNDGNYEPSNCRFITNKENSSNRRTSKIITYGDKTMNLKEWAEELNINYSTLTMRLNKYGWSIEKAFTKEVDNVL